MPDFDFAAAPKGSVLFINRVFPPDSGASGLRLMEMCQGMAESGWAVTVLTNRGRNMTPPNLDPRVHVVRLGFGSVDKKPTPLQYALWLVALWWRALFLPAHTVTITLTDPPMAAVITALLSVFKKTRTIHWVHDLYPDLLPAMGVRLPVVLPALKAISRWALRRHDAVVAIGDDMQQVLAENGVAAAKIAVIPNWPDVQAALLDKKKPKNHDRNIFVIEGAFTVLYSGNFGLVHDFTPLIDAIKIVQQSPYPIRFILAGDGRKYTRVRDTIESMMLTNVHFIRAQPRDKFIDMLLAGDLHIATMIPESLGLVAPSKINSALGLGRPCVLVGPKQAFQAKLIERFKAGRVVDPADPQAKFKLAEAIIHYASDSEAFHEAQANALVAAESIRFDKALAQFDALCTTVAAA